LAFENIMSDNPFYIRYNTPKKNNNRQRKPQNNHPSRDSSESSGDDSDSMDEPEAEISGKDALGTVYRDLGRWSGKMGADGYNMSIYGEVGQAGMKLIFERMEHHMNFNSESVFADFGSGLGVPNWHALVGYGCTSIGVEFETYRWFLSFLMMKNVQKNDNLKRWGLVSNTDTIFFVHADLGDKRIKNFNGLTHIYWFDCGFPPTVVQSIVNALKNTTGPLYLTCFIKEHKLNTYFGLDRHWKLHNKYHQHVQQLPIERDAREREERRDHDQNTTV